MNTLMENMRSARYINNVPLTFLLIISSILFVVPNECFSGNITGTVTNADDGLPIENVEVQFYDALNADLLGSSFTSPNGNYKSDTIPDGKYRVLFLASGFEEEYYGAGGVADFCYSEVVYVQTGKATIVDEQMVPKDPSQIAACCYDFVGIVMDASTMTPIDGIKVTLNDSDSAIGGYVEAITGASKGGMSGYFVFSFAYPIAPVKMRFSDPSGRYYPEYFGASDTDDFCLGATLDTDNLTIESYLEPLTGEDAIVGIIDGVGNLNLPNNVTTMLTTPVVRAVDLLTDSNSNNDAGVCHQLTAFVSRVDIQEKNGQLTVNEADALRDTAMTISLDLGC